MRSRAVLPVLLVLALCPYFIDLGGSSIWDANEAFYVETPREMIERGDYVNPTFNYRPRINKPVLSYWIVAGFYNVLWVSPGVQRIPIALGGMVLIAVAFVLARAAAPDRRSPEGDGGPPSVARAAAWWAALGLALSPRLLMFARRIFIDIYISMFMALTLACFALAERYPARRRLFLVSMYVCVGLGVLTKGPVAVLLPGLVFAVYLAAHRELGRTRHMLLPLGVVIVAAIVVPWYAALYQRSGWEPIVKFLVGENFDRYAHGVGVGADHRGLLWYLPVVFSDSFPWSFLLVPAAVMWFRERSGSAAPSDRRVRALLWIWIVVIVGFFSLSAGKQDLYIFPIVPAVAALGGVTIARALSAEGKLIGPTGVGPAVAAIGVVLIVIGAAFFALFHGPFAVYVLDGSATIGVVAMAAGAVTTMLAARGRIAGALQVAAAALIVSSGLFVIRVLPSFEAYKPAPALATALHRIAQPDDLIVTYNVALPSLVYYLRRHTEVYYDHDPVLRLLESNRPLYLMLTSDDYDKIIAPASPVRLCRIASQPTFDVKLRNVLSRVRLPEVMLVTNKCGGG